MRAIIKRVVPDFIVNRYQQYKKRRKSRLYRGEGVICPICQSTFRIFGPYGVVERANAECLQCGSLERQRLLWLYLRHKTDFFDRKTSIRLLHFAPEKELYEVFSRQENIEYVPCDISPALYKTDGRVEIRQADITDIPFGDNYFDVILCMHVLEHIPDDRLAMRELCRVMKKDGWGILQVPVDYNRERTYEDFSIVLPKAREKAFGQEDHVRWYGRDYPDRLREAGFRVKEEDYLREFSAERVHQFGLMPSELVYYCSR